MHFLQKTVWNDNLQLTSSRKTDCKENESSYNAKCAKMILQLLITKKESYFGYLHTKKRASRAVLCLVFFTKLGKCVVEVRLINHDVVDRSRW